MITSPDAPIDVMITLSPINIVQAAADLIWSPILREFPNADVRPLRGWHRVDALLPGADRLHVPAPQGVDHQDFGDKLPSQVFLERIVTCFIDDRSGSRAATI